MKRCISHLPIQLRTAVRHHETGTYHLSRVTFYFLLVTYYLLLYPLKAQIDVTETITKTGTAAAQFLKIGVGARGSGMGNAFTAMSGDLSAMYWNPAGMAYIYGVETMFVNSQWLAGIDFNYFAFAYNIRGIGVIGASVTALSVPDDIVRTVEKPEGTGELFDANDMAINLSFAKRLTDKFSIGGNIKFIRQQIWHASASTVAADLGALFITPFKNIRLGASLSNFGNNMQLIGRDLNISVDPDPNNEGNVEFIDALYQTDAFPLPLLFRVGISGELIQTNAMRVSFGLDALHPNDNAESVNTGIEVAFSETFFIRGGYSSLFREDSEEGFTLGAGLNYRVWGTSTILKLDYSYSDYQRLEGVQRISLGFKF